MEAPKSSGKRASVMTERNLDHLEYDDNLYDYMKSLIPFNIATTNPQINQHLLNTHGLERGQFLNIFFNDGVGKQEICYELILSAVLPKEWTQEEESGQDAQGQTQGVSASHPSQTQTNATGAATAYEDTKVIQEGQELQCVLLDILGQFSARKFMEKVRHVYDKHKLHEVLGPKASEEQIKANQHLFVRTVLQNLFVFPCMDAIEFNIAVRGLNSFLRRNKSVGLVVVDGIHFIENQEILAQSEKRKVRDIVSNRPGKGTTVEAMAALDVPTEEDFFGGASQPTTTQKPNAVDHHLQQKSQFFVQKLNRQTGASRSDAKIFDQKLVDRALSVISELQATYNFAIVKTQARPFMRKAADLQEEVMNRGIDVNQIPKHYAPQVSENDMLGSSQLPGYGQILVESQIQTDDDQMRDRIRTLQRQEVLILRGDRDNSLVPRPGQSLGETLMQQHLSCLVVPHWNFQGKQLQQASYLNRYLAVYVLFKSQQHVYNIKDQVVKAFYI